MALSVSIQPPNPEPGQPFCITITASAPSTASPVLSLQGMDERWTTLPLSAGPEPLTWVYCGQRPDIGRLDFLVKQGPCVWQDAL